jgi:hypothetical protein
VRRGRAVLLFFSGLLCLAVLYAPLLIAGWATAIAIEALSSGEFSVGLSSLWVAAIYGMIWLLPVPAWFLIMRVHRTKSTDLMIHSKRNEEKRGTMSEEERASMRATAEASGMTRPGGSAPGGGYRGQFAILAEQVIDLLAERAVQ